MTDSTDFTSWQFTFSACEIGVERHLLLYTTGRADGGNTDRSNHSAAEMLPQTEMLQPTAVCAVAIFASAVTVAEEDVAEIFTCSLGLDVANLTAIVWLVTEHGW